MQASTPPDHTPESWSAAAEAYEKWMMPTSTLYAEDALRLVDLKPGERVLDVAAGTGALALAASRWGAEVIATDSSPGMIERLRARVAREEIAGLTVKLMDGQALELPDDSFDAALSIFGFMFFPDRHKGFRELLRVLRPGGRAAIATWGPSERVRMVEVVSNAVKAAVPEFASSAKPSPALSLQDASVLMGEMESAGFRMVRIESATHSWGADSPEIFWEHWHKASPTLAGLLRQVGPSKSAMIRDAFVDILRKEFGEAPVRLQGQAHIGIGVK
jgi:ubiquinone/menaquinone biosynthesis C-methylase UbiE